MDYYKSNCIQNQSIVYQEFLALEYKNSVSTFLDELDAHLSAISAVGLVVGIPEKANIKESLLAESILAKLPADFSSTKEILYTKRPLTLKMIRKSLNAKRHKGPSISSFTPSIKQESALAANAKSGTISRKSYPQCSPGKHNPTCTGQTLEECNQAKRKSQAKAKAAVRNHLQFRNFFHQYHSQRACLYPLSIICSQIPQHMLSGQWRKPSYVQ
ncbi:uncharacterized protein VP01_8280g1 [Puccinia sorghi]|uniref:Uncharacterized protein n=1 Tax=Puccinia sorghi TaxID=27349 RepID=A0A0L6U9R8_9BASI|nr:uncharacterized protein VP01_8280g1 [Puccinia sorghi]